MERLTSFFVNEKITVKNQLQRSFCCITVFAGGITLGICLGMVYGLATDSYTTARGTIFSQCKENLNTVAQEIGNSVDQQLRLIAESICMTSALYSSILLPYSTFKNNDTLMSDKLSFKEFNFVSGCSYPDCPSDFGLFNGNSRFPPLSHFTEGSLADSSVYLYSSAYNHGIRNESLWSSVLSSNPTIGNVIDGLVYQDTDFITMFNRGPNTTVMFYLASQITDNVEDAATAPYDVVLRTYPGILKNVTHYDPSARPWFENAPEDAFWLYGPYQETCTKQFVVTLSSRKQSVVGSKNVTTVSAAVILLTSLKDLVNSVEYTNGGFGALVKADTKEVLVWGTRDDLFDEDRHTFKTVADLDSVLAGKIGTNSDTISYTNAKGVEWVVAVEPFFSVSSHMTGETDNCLMLLVFGKKTEIQHPLAQLQNNIDTTTNTVTTSTIVIVVVTIGVVMLLVCLVVWYITHPLSQMIEMSHEIVQISGEPDEKQDYTAALKRARTNMSRSDEIGQLALDYYHIVCLLHNKNVEKKHHIAKYPENPFYMQLEQSVQEGSQKPPLLTWSAFYAGVQAKTGCSSPVEQVIVAETQAEVEDKLVDIENSDEAELGVVVPAVRAADRRSSRHANRKKSKYEASATGDGHVKPVPEPVAEHSQSSIKTDVSAIYPVVSGDSIRSGSRKPSFYSAISSFDIEQGTSKMIDTVDEKVISPSRRMLMQAWKDSLVNLPTLTKDVSYFASIKSQLYALCALLLVGVLATMGVTITELREEGSSWMSESSESLLHTQVANLQSITDIKAVYVQNYFSQMSLDLLVGQSYFYELMDRNLTRPDFVARGDYLPSYSLDTYNTYYLKPSNLQAYSSYFRPSDAGCQLRNTSGGCDVVRNDNLTRLTSLFDVKMHSYYHANSFVSFVQFGLESNGLTRYYPFTSNSYGHPTSCLIGDTTNSTCHDHYYNSACYAASGIRTYFPYDPRCRPWYQTGRKAAADFKNEIYFQYPKMSVSGVFVVTAVVPFLRGDSLFAVINSNYVVTVLSDAINSLKISGSGYVYLIDNKNTSIVILHPGLTSSCHLVSCAESFTHEEYFDFRTSILTPLQNEDFENVADTYVKNGQSWQLTYSFVKFGAIDYTLIATMPRDEFLKSSTKVHDSINTAVFGMIIAFSCVAFFCLTLLVYFALTLVHAIVKPIHDLHRVMKRAKTNDLSGTIPTHATSLDMKILMEAFTKFMITLRCGSDSYARGNPKRALRVFSEALELYTVTDNKSGMGASLNNLAVVELSLQHYAKAKEYNQRSIEIATELLTAATAKNGTDDDELGVIRRTLSDREGNLALILLEEDMFAEALAILERLLVEDKKTGYIKGCVVKQGTLGQYYLKRGQLAKAEKTFLSALNIVEVCTTDEHDTEAEDWNRFETATAMQIALYNIALLQQAQKVPSEVLIDTLVKCLVTTEHIHTATTTKALVMLRSVFQTDDQKQQMAEVKSLAEQHQFNLHQAMDKTQLQARNAATKRVAFVIDYSRKMSGVKIASAIANVKNIFENHIYDGDSIMLVTFNAHVRVVLRLVNKTASNNETILRMIDSVNEPSGSSAFYDALKYTVARLERGSSVGCDDWIIALTDGEDNASRESLDGLLDALSVTKVNLVVMGMGEDEGEKADEVREVLEDLTGCMQSARGIYIAADEKEGAENRQSMDEAFAKVTLLIQGQLIMEEV